MPVVHVAGSLCQVALRLPYDAPVGPPYPQVVAHAWMPPVAAVQTPDGRLERPMPVSVISLQYGLQGLFVQSTCVPSWSASRATPAARTFLVVTCEPTHSPHVPSSRHVRSP